MCDILDRDFTKENDVPSDEEDYIDISADD